MLDQCFLLGDLMKFHRADFHGILLSHLSPSCKTHTSKRLVSYSQPTGSLKSPIILTFADGSSSSCDLLVGADGIKSAVRGYMMRDVARSLRGQAVSSALSCIDPIWSGVVAYRSLINGEKLRACAPHHRALREPTVVRCDALNWRWSTDNLHTVHGEGRCKYEIR